MCVWCVCLCREGAAFELSDDDDFQGVDESFYTFDEPPEFDILSGLPSTRASSASRGGKGFETPRTHGQGGGSRPGSSSGRLPSLSSARGTPRSREDVRLPSIGGGHDHGRSNGDGYQQNQHNNNYHTSSFSQLPPHHPHHMRRSGSRTAIGADGPYGGGGAPGERYIDSPASTPRVVRDVAPSPGEMQRRAERAERLEKQREKVQEEWGFKDPKTAALMLKRQRRLQKVKKGGGTGAAEKR